jgi:hypothetical protein
VNLPDQAPRIVVRTMRDQIAKSLYQNLNGQGDRFLAGRAIVRHPR